MPALSDLSVEMQIAAGRQIRQSPDTPGSIEPDFGNVPINSP